MSGSPLAFPAKKELLASLREGQAKSQKEQAILAERLEEATAWIPPTTKHDGLKEFMIQQLTTSMEGGDFYDRELAKAEPRSPGSFYAEAVISAERDIPYYEKQLAEETERAKSRTEWLSKLRESLTVTA